MDNSTVVLAEDYVLPEAIKGTWLWISTVASSAVLLNLVVTFTLIRVNNLLPPTTRILFIHQSSVEALSAAVNFMLQNTQQLSTLEFPVSSFGFFLCLLYSACFWSVDTILQLNNMLITLDRYLAVCFVFSRVFTRGRVKCCICVIWLIGIGFNFLNYYYIMEVTPSGECLYNYAISRDILLPFGIFYMISFDFGPVIFVILLYPQMIYAIRKSVKPREESTSGSSKDHDRAKVKSAAAARLVKTCLIATVILIMTNTPDIILYSIMYCILNIKHSQDPLEVSIDMSFKVAYPFLSPIIYSFSTQKFRSAVVSAFKC